MQSPIWAALDALAMLPDGSGSATLEDDVGWPSYKEDIQRRREEAGLDPVDETWRRRPKMRRDDFAEARQEFKERNAAHAKAYRAQQRRTAFWRFFSRLFRRIFGG